jgi:tripartite-type tricarboxylate transporter receptor subunit TctC
MKKSRLIAWAAPLAMVAGIFAAASARADAVSDFYKGKQIHMIVGYSPGGGYDSYGRLLAKYMGEHIPGHPTIIIQNMPGAGSLKATNYLYNVAPKDGTYIGIFARNMPLLGVLKTDQNVQFDPRKFTWLGSSSSYANDAYTLLIRKSAKVKSIAEARKPGGPPIILGSTAAGTSSDAMALVLRDLLGFNVKVIGGYRDSASLFLAMERGEIDGRTVGLSAVRANKPEWAKPNGPMRVLVVFGRPTRYPGFPDVPTARELARNASDLAIIKLLELPYTLSRPFAAPPGIPADRAKALEAAFMATHKDPGYVRDATRMGIDVSPINGKEILQMINEISDTPPAVLKRVTNFIEGGHH